MKFKRLLATFYSFLRAFTVASLFKISGILFIGFVFLTYVSYSSPIKSFKEVSSEAKNIQLLDRYGKAMIFTYQNDWNNYDFLPLHETPQILLKALIISEDKHYYKHQGVDWFARAKALWQRVAKKQNSRGASTITEQVIRMLNNRDRNYWSKWIEGIEAFALEQRYSKEEILEFYLNQVPYGANRRGLIQAARFYFNRDLNTLNLKEMLALIVLIRAPSKYDLYSSKVKVENAILRLGNKLYEENIINQTTLESLKAYQLSLEMEELPVHATHFVDYLRNKIPESIKNRAKIVTTIDGNIQYFVHNLLETRLKSLKSRNVKNAAAIVVDNQTREVLAWVSVGLNCKESNNQASGCMIDMVNTPRQPASSLKPFLYALALEKGWNADTRIDDSPYIGAIRSGTHHFHNYSNLHYGKVSLRIALGNSLNIPALHTINYVTPKKYLARLQSLGFKNLTEDVEFYDEGLALGNGESTLFQVAQAYSTLANKGVFEPLRVSFFENNQSYKKQVYSEEVTSLIGNILSDPWARNLEFGRNSALNLPTQTAVKTGTSTDYRDAWAVGYDSKYTVGVWMGNIDYTATSGLTGAIGPSLVLRGILNHLNLDEETNSLYLSPNLEIQELCIPINEYSEESQCKTYTEYFLPGRSSSLSKLAKVIESNITILKPSNKLEMAVDNRIPLQHQAYEMKVQGIMKDDLITWIIDGKNEQISNRDNLLWQPSKGKHIAQVRVERNGKSFLSEKNEFYVK